MCMVAIFLITGTVAAADFFNALINTSEEDLAMRIFALPREIQKLIFDIAKEQNKVTIKSYIKTSLEFKKHTVDWYDIKHYLAFRNYGTQCTHIISFYPKDGTPCSIGVNTYTPLGTKIDGTWAIASLHTIKDGKINTIDCMSLEKRKQIEAPVSYNGIQLNQKEPGWVYWLNENYAGGNTKYCEFKTKDDTYNMKHSCIML